MSSIPIKNILDENEINIDALKKCLLEEFPSFNKKFFTKSSNEKQWSEDIEYAIEKAYELSTELDQHFIGMEHVFYSILLNCSDVSKYLTHKGVDVEKLCKEFLLVLNSKNSDDKKSQKNLSNEIEEEKFISIYKFLYL